MSDLPIACTLSPAALEARRSGLADLLRRAEGRDELLDGYRLRFAATEHILPAIARTVDAERHCCRFLRFTITVQPDGGPIWLDAQGPPGTREFLSKMFDGDAPQWTPYP